MDGRAVAVVDAAPDDRPPVVATRQDQVELVAALGPVLRDPDVPGLGMNCEALLVAVPVAPDLGERPRSADHRVVRGHAAVVVEPDDRAVMVREVLCRMSLEVARRGRLPIPDRDEQVSVVIECEPRSVVAAAAAVGLEQLLDIAQAVVLEPAAHDYGRRRAAAERLREAHVEQPVRREVGVGNHVEEAGLTVRVDGGHAGHRVGQEPSVPDDAEPPRLLGDQQVATG
jgi:hypothetical protein